MNSAENYLIARLPRRDRIRLLTECEAVELKVAQALAAPGETIHSVYFPVDGFVSLLTQIAPHPGLEIGMVGREGMLGAPLAVGVAIAPLLAVVQEAGTARRISRQSFARLLSNSAALRHGVGLYLHILTVEVALAAGCLHFHPIGPRLARRLLMTHDRCNHDSFHLTHEHLAETLGVRRVGITHAAGAFQRGGLIEYHRGTVTVLDRRGLEAASCSCYQVARHAYTARLGEAERSDGPT